MTIALTPEQTRWLEQVVSEGRFASFEAAIQVAVTNLMIEQSNPAIADDWVLPLLDDARAAVSRGESVSLDEFKARAAQRHVKAG